MSRLTPRCHRGDDGRARAGRILHVREAHASRALGAGQLPHAVAHALGEARVAAVHAAVHGDRVLAVEVGVDEGERPVEAGGDESGGAPAELKIDRIELEVR